MEVNSAAPNPVPVPGSRRHLFIINPAAKRIKGNTKPVTDAIAAFFAKHTWITYDVYVSEWCRDAIMYIQQYVEGITTGEVVRIHAMGGTGMLFEVINSVVGLPHVEVASYPYGKANSFLKYFGARNEKLFSAIESQVFDQAVPMDVIRCGNNYGICYGMTGIEAYANILGEVLINKKLPGDISYMFAGVCVILGGKVSQKYFIEIDGEQVEGDFISIMVANAPCYGLNMYPAIDAHPDDGMLDVYVVKNAPTMKILRIIPGYTHGKYRSMPDLVSHYRAKKIRLSSDQVMCISVDAEYFYGTSIEYEVMPHAIKFVCPVEIDLMKLPRVYNRPREGLRGE